MVKENIRTLEFYSHFLMLWN